MASTKRYKDEDWLRREYKDKLQTLDEVAEKCGVTRTTISDWLDRYGIEKRSQKETQRLQQDGKHTDREWLAEQYHGKERTLKEMANMCDVDKVTIMNWMERYDIPRRDASHHKKVSPAEYRTDREGYVRVSSKTNGRKKYAKIHQLIAIANGADPYKVFSNGEYQCHHKKPIPWLNTPDNIEVLSQQEHDRLHAAERERTATGEFV